MSTLTEAAAPAAASAPQKKKYAGGNQAANAWIRDLKGSTPCTDCGARHPWWVMEADHIDGSTARERGGRPSTAANGRSPCGTSRAADLKRELISGAAEVVCANCHKQRTHERREARKQAA